MKDMNYLIYKKDNKWFSVSDTVPYFCFESDSEQEARNNIKQALTFYYNYKSNEKEKI